MCRDVAHKQDARADRADRLASKVYEQVTHMSHICTRVSIHMPINISMLVSVSISIHTHTHIYTHVCTHSYTHVYTLINTGDACNKEVAVYQDEPT